MRFLTLEELNQKVGGSFCCINGDGPYFVREFTANSVVIDDGSDDLKVAKGDPRELKFTPPMIGNVQIEGGDSIYVSRRPSRTYRVGLSRNNTTNREFFGYPVKTMIQGLKQIRDNSYPYSNNYREYTKKGIRVALSRKYSISSKNIYFRGKKVAKMFGKKAVFENADDMNFHMDNLMSLIEDVQYEFKERKVLRYEQDDI